MRHIRWGWWLLAITLSVTIHGLLFFTLAKHKPKAFPLEEGAAELAHVRLTFLQPLPAPPVPEPEPEPEPEPDPEPEIKPKSEPKPAAKPKPKSRHKPKPAAPAAPPPVPSQRREVPEKTVSAAELRERYLASLLARIEKRKAYPMAARRRAIEGSVGVSFIVACDGSVGDINIRRGHKLSKRSAAKAVVLAQPFPQRPEKVKCPLPVIYVMAFELK